MGRMLDRAGDTGLGARAWPQQRSLALPILCVHILVLSEVGLPLPHVPVQTLGQAPEPVTHRVPHADGGQRVAGGSDADAGRTTRAVSRTQTPAPGLRLENQPRATLDPAPQPRRGHLSPAHVASRVAWPQVLRCPGGQAICQPVLAEDSHGPRAQWYYWMSQDRAVEPQATPVCGCDLGKRWQGG